jgi:hypothetical protein
VRFQFLKNLKFLVPWQIFFLSLLTMPGLRPAIRSINFHESLYDRPQSGAATTRAGFREVKEIAGWELRTANAR